jgi:hypothetical protein
MNRTVLGAGLAVIALSGCASLKNTPPQDYSWELGRACQSENADWRMTRVEPGGRYWIRAGDASGANAFHECMARQQKAKPYREWLAQHRADYPALQADEARAFIHRMYTTDAPPKVGTFIDGIANTRPPEVSTFRRGTPVTVYFSMYQQGRVVDGELRWLTPDRTPFLVQPVLIDQLGKAEHGTWNIRTTDKELAPGAWVVELILGGHSVRTYNFTVTE